LTSLRLTNTSPTLLGAYKGLTPFGLNSIFKRTYLYLPFKAHTKPKSKRAESAIFENTTIKKTP
ncbi:MAG: hypothetical protein D8M25_13475, partial [Bacteroidetes bacterium]|nr:hypothetical protein [Bacteroidota bacterium]